MQLDWQLLIVIAIVAWAIGYLFRRFFLKKSVATCGTDCGCTGKQKGIK